MRFNNSSTSLEIPLLETPDFVLSRARSKEAENVVLGLLPRALEAHRSKIRAQTAGWKSPIANLQGDHQSGWNECELLRSVFVLQLRLMFHQFLCWWINERDYIPRRKLSRISNANGAVYLNKGYIRRT